MLRTLYARLALTLFLLLLTVGAGLMVLVTYTSAQYEQEVTQKLNRELAQNIAEAEPLIQHEQVNHSALDTLFHQLMIVNPSIELYLLDNSGNILAYSAPEGRVQRKQVSLEPIIHFIDQTHSYPIRGDDPRSINGQKVFSAARLVSPESESKSTHSKSTQGYLYIVLGGEQYDNAAQMLGNSVIVDSAMQLLLVALGTAFIAGLFIFSRLTRRIRQLSTAMKHYAENTTVSLDTEILSPRKVPRDEVDHLYQQFREMSGRIDEQINTLRRMDNQRREMVANVSHDLRTPLTTMRGYLETLSIKYDQLSDADKQSYLQTALSHCQRLGRLIEELFELARLDSCETVLYSEAFSISELVQDVAQKFELRARQQGVQLNVLLEPDVPAVYGDIAMMQRVLDNLLENALRYTPAGGRISLRVDNDSGRAKVQVSDSGKGIDSSEVEKIFDRFYTSSSQRRQESDISEGSTKIESTGLGLAIVKRILELHGSLIRVDSKRQEGTTFSFKLDTQHVQSIN